MAWQSLASDDLQSALTKPELDLFTSGSAAFGTNRLDQIVKDVANLVRGKVAAFPENRNSMGPEGTIPEEVYGDAIEIARFKLLTSFPQGKMFLDDARMEGFRAANRHLDDAANGKLVIEPAASLIGTGNAFDPNASAFGSRDDYLNNPAKRYNDNVIDFGFWQG